MPWPSLYRICPRLTSTQLTAQTLVVGWKPPKSHDLAVWPAWPRLCVPSSPLAPPTNLTNPFLAEWVVRAPCTHVLVVCTTVAELPRSWAVCPLAQQSHARLLRASIWSWPNCPLAGSLVRASARARPAVPATAGSWDGRGPPGHARALPPCARMRWAVPATAQRRPTTRTPERLWQPLGQFGPSTSLSWLGGSPAAHVPVPSGEVAPGPSKGLVSRRLHAHASACVRRLCAALCHAEVPPLLRKVPTCGTLLIDRAHAFGLGKGSPGQSELCCSRLRFVPPRVVQLAPTHGYSSAMSLGVAWTASIHAPKVGKPSHELAARAPSLSSRVRALAPSLGMQVGLKTSSLPLTILAGPPAPVRPGVTCEPATLQTCAGP